MDVGVPVEVSAGGKYWMLSDVCAVVAVVEGEGGIEAVLFIYHLLHTQMKMYFEIPRY
jgi:hypothetical protein